MSTLFFIDIASRSVHVAGITSHPANSWITQIARNVTDADAGFLRGKRHLILDRDSYFASRDLWPLPPDCPLRGHPSVEYWERVADVWRVVGSFPALVADVVDIAGQLVASHVTYLHQIDRVPVWAALNTSLLMHFEPPPGVLRLRVYADRDDAGLRAARTLMDRLRGRVQLELCMPPAPANDWNDVLITCHSRVRGQGHSHD